MDTIPSIKIKYIKLINWYRFENTEIIPVNDTNLVIARNGQGKSVFMDAIRFALFHDYRFNPASGTGTERTLKGTCRCEINGDYHRPASEYPDVYSHIAIEFEDQGSNPFVIDTLIHIKPTDDNNTITRYIIEGQTLEQIESILVNEEGEPASNKTIKQAFPEAPFYTPSQIDKIHNRIGWRFNDSQRKALKQIMFKAVSFTPTKHIEDFIRGTVHLEDNVDLTTLIKYRTQIEDIQTKYASLTRENELVSGILECNQETETVQQEYDKQERLFHYLTIRSLTDDIEIQKNTLELARAEQNKTDNDLNRIQQDIGRVNRALTEYNEGMVNFDNELRIKKKELEDKESELEAVISKIEEIRLLEDRTIYILDNFSSPAALPCYKTITELAEPSVSDEEKQEAISEAFAHIRKLYEDNQQKIGIMKMKIEDLTADIVSKETSLRHYKSNNYDYSILASRKELCDAINSKAKKTVAMMAFEYVISLKDEKWRNALEAYLGFNRFNIIVERDYFDLALRELDTVKDKRIRIINTPRLMEKEFNVEQDSAVNLLSITHPVAFKYFAYLLGHVHAVPKNDVPNYDNAISYEGRVSGNMCIYNLDTSFKAIKMYCIGQDSIERNIKFIEEELSRLIGKKREHESTINECLYAIPRLDNYLKTFEKTYSFSVLRTQEVLERKIRSLKETVAELEDSLSTNAEFIALMKVIKQTEEEKELLEKEESEAIFRRNSISSKIESVSGSIKISEEALSQSKLRLDDLIEKNPESYNIMLASVKERERAGEKLQAPSTPYRKMNALKTSIDEHNQKRIRLITEFRVAFPACLQRVSINSYNSETISEIIKILNNRYRVINTDNAPKAQEELDNMKRKYEAEFRDNFIGQIYKRCCDAKINNARLNKRLQLLQLEENYRFKCENKTDGDYAVILKYGEFINKQKQQAADGRILTPLEYRASLDEKEQIEYEETEKEVIRIINNLVNEPSKDYREARMEELSDYRNYMTYTMIYNDVESGKDIDYEKVKAPHASGAETQIPYYIVLLTALMSYYSGKQCLRLFLIDEAFNKVDAEKTINMMRFIRSQELQSVICTPRGLECFGSESDCILTMVPDEETEQSHLISSVDMGYAKLKSLLKDTEKAFQLSGEDDE